MTRRADGRGADLIKKGLVLPHPTMPRPDLSQIRTKPSPIGPRTVIWWWGGDCGEKKKILTFSTGPRCRHTTNNLLFAALFFKKPLSLCKFWGWHGITHGCEEGLSWEAEGPTLLGRCNLTGWDGSFETLQELVT